MIIVIDKQIHSDAQKAVLRLVNSLCKYIRKVVCVIIAVSVAEIINIADNSSKCKQCGQYDLYK